MYILIYIYIYIYLYMSSCLPRAVTLPELSKVVYVNVLRCILNVPRPPRRSGLVCSHWPPCLDNHSLINTSLIIRPSILFSNATSSNTTFLNSEGQAHHQLHRPPGRPRQEHQHLRHALSGPWKLSGRFRYVSVIHVSVTLPSTFPLRFRWAGVCPTETLQKLSRNSPNVSGALQGHARARVVRVALPRDDQDLHGQHRLREGASPAQGRRGGD